MAEKHKSMSWDALVLAVDTWLGAEDHWISDEWFPSLRIHCGIPSLERTFMSNVVAMHLIKYVVPLPVDSINAYHVVRPFCLQPDIVHIDAGHKYESVSQDVHAWSFPLRDGGIMICSHYLLDENDNPAGWVEVVKAVNEHLQTDSSAINSQHGGNKCMFQKSTH